MRSISPAEQPEAPVAATTVYYYIMITVRARLLCIDEIIIRGPLVNHNYSTHLMYYSFTDIIVINKKNKSSFLYTFLCSVKT